MAKNKEKTFWPHMIVGFLFIGITLGYWTVKHAVALPVQESNNYMMKYQQADININEIMEKKARFDQDYKIELTGVQKVKIVLENTKRAKDELSVVLNSGMNSFSYKVLDKNNHQVNDANVTFLLTRPHTQKDDILKNNVPLVNGVYKIDSINVVNAGRYMLQLKVKIADEIGYLETPAHLSNLKSL